MNALAERLATEARAASRRVARAGGEARTRAILAAADHVKRSADAILEANRGDVERGTDLPAPMIERLRLDGRTLDDLVRAMREVAALPDPIGRMDSEWTRPNGLRVGRMRIPLGVILMIYESRPNVTTDAFALCLRSGNAAILRGGSDALRTNLALGESIAHGLKEAGLPAAAAVVVPDPDRGVMESLLQREREIDLAIPRGGEGLIRFVSEHARMPVVKHDRGVCHVYIDAAADVEKAAAICENAKAQRPGVCNACETILIHEAAAERAVPVVAARLRARGVEIRGDDRVVALVPGAKRAADGDWGREFLDLIVAMRVVSSLAGAVEHIERYGSNHTEAIVTEDGAAADAFVRSVDSSTVLVNASTRFADGGELGLGAEVGISTTRVHAYGPMGIEGLTATKFVVIGNGQVRT